MNRVKWTDDSQICLQVITATKMSDSFNIFMDIPIHVYMPDGILIISISCCFPSNGSVNILGLLHKVGSLAVSTKETRTCKIAV
jgi:hypothetical protein